MQLSLTFPTTELQGAFPANAEILFKFLAVDTKFADWITRRITQYGFIENQDYIINATYTGRRPRKEYFITLNMAKELCMVENNEKGKEARRYFIQCEQELQALKFKHHQSQINGYKSQIAQRNKQILRLKHRLCVAEIRMSEIYDAEVIDDSQIEKESLRALLHNARLERDYYFKKANELKQKQKFKDSEITRLLNNIQIQMDGVFKEIDVAMRYTNDDDYYLQITK
ncbi:antA/AntB antirepressor family protein [Campylobacter sp. faydin G-24]|uniref:AntA/AntB antirepressor family protein n=1 Tax=Campylobacter anatolicus TaxID=2829105 RepID=A0ABS5HLA6_9BACT|nr:antA/AntB antirepressor family protein [Campylobacter anatolicus]MBR8464422.1 antA/AntB antirepressor family protein [Campylobacter anatolicus]